MEIALGKPGWSQWQQRPGKEQYWFYGVLWVSTITINCLPDEIIQIKERFFKAHKDRMRLRANVECGKFK